MRVLREVIVQGGDVREEVAQAALGEVGSTMIVLGNQLCFGAKWHVLQQQCM
jgi:hypothetical protein